MASIKIDPNTNQAFLLDDAGNPTKVFSIGTGDTTGTRFGKKYFSPVGKHKIKNVVPYKQIENSYGPFWIGLSAKGYGLHGPHRKKDISETKDCFTNNGFVSHGCIRFLEEDIKELAKILKPDDMVEILPYMIRNKGILDTPEKVSPDNKDGLTKDEAVAELSKFTEIEMAVDRPLINRPEEPIEAEIIIEPPEDIDLQPSGLPLDLIKPSEPLTVDINDNPEDIDLQPSNLPLDPLTVEAVMPEEILSEIIPEEDPSAESAETSIFEPKIQSLPDDIMNQIFPTEEPAEDVVTAPPDMTDTEEEQPSGFSQFLEKAGVILSVAAAIKGDTNPLQLLLASSIGLGRAEQAREDEAEEARQQALTESVRERETKVKEGNLSLARLKFIEDMNKDPNKQIVKDKLGNMYTFNPESGEVEAVPGMSFKPQTSSEFNLENGFRYKTIKTQNETGGFDETFELIGVETEESRGDLSGNTIIRRSVFKDPVTGKLKPHTRVVLTELGRKRMLMAELKLAREETVGFQNMLDKQVGIKEAGAMERDYNNLIAIAEDMLENKQAPGARQIALINQFQRLIDPATVREGDVALIRSAQSTMEAIGVRLARIGSGQVISDDLTISLIETATAMINAQRRYRKDLIDLTLETANVTMSERGRKGLKGITKAYLTHSVEPDLELIRSRSFGVDDEETMQEVARLKEAKDYNALNKLVAQGSVAAERAIDELEAADEVEEETEDQ